MFSALRDKISDKLWSLGSDDVDRTLQDSVTRGTAETLISPEWSINMALVDMVNQNSTVVPEKLLKVLKRAMMKPNAKTQILTLTILETCIKNCDPALYAALATSELWLELVKMTADTSISRVDAEVRDKILCLVEDYAKVLPQKEFRESYHYLLEHGVDFPVRSPDDQPPILTPPVVYQPPPVMPAGSPPLLSPAGSVAAAAHHAPPPAPAEDPFAGMSAEDRAAVQAAMAEMEEEERAVRESAALAASTALLQHVHQPDQLVQHPSAADGGLLAGPLPSQQQQAAQQPQQQQQQRQAPAPRQDPGPALPENPEEALQMIGNATGLLNELLASETDPREPFVVELAEQCVRLQSKLETVIDTMTDEAQLNEALTHHEALQAAISKYNEHLAKAEQGAAVAAPAAGLQTRPLQQPTGDHHVPGPHSPPAPAAAPFPVLAPVHSAGPNFTLLGDDDEADLLSSNRGQQAGNEPQHAAAPAPPAADLIDLGDCAAPDEPLHGVAAAAASPPQEQLDSLLQGMAVHEESAHPPLAATAGGASPAVHAHPAAAEGL